VDTGDWALSKQLDCRRQWLGRVLRTALLLVTLGVVVSSTTSAERPGGTTLAAHRPELIFDDSVGADFQALALQTWDHFLVVFQARSNCFGDVRLHAAYTLDSRAGYDPNTATVTVQVPGTPAKLQSALVHEWAHHVEFQCREHQALRAAFLAAQGLPPDTPWRPDGALGNRSTSEWAAEPSEQYAEATVELVLGRRPLPAPAQVSREAIRVVGEWAAGD
jgi:hypothetical protein